MAAHEGIRDAGNVVRSAGVYRRADQSIEVRFIEFMNFRVLEFCLPAAPLAVVVSGYGALWLSTPESSESSQKRHEGVLNQRYEAKP